MPRKRLTEEGVARLKPPAEGKQIDYFDAGMPGLVLRVNYGGAKVWRALYYRKKLGNDGKKLSIPTTHKIGVFPHLSVKDARKKAGQFLADPQAALAQADSGSFREVAENFLKRHVEASKLRTQGDIERNLKKHVFPEWEQRPFREIKRGDVASLLDKIEDQSGPRQADVVLAIIRKMMNWYAARNDDYVSPIVKGMNRYSAGDRKRKRILNDDEIRALWAACGEAGSFGAIVKLLLLTAQRRDKVATMKRSDVPDDVWTIASEAREKSNAGGLGLPKAALDIIKAQLAKPEVAGNPFVFPGSMQGRRRKGKDGKIKVPTELPSFNSFSQRKAELDRLMLNELHKAAEQRNDQALLAYVANVRTLLKALATAKGDAREALELEIKRVWWVIHDLRRTAKSLMTRAGVRPDISERVLGHAIAGVEGVYDQYDYSDEKADALNRLAALIETIRNPPEGNVVALAGAASKAREKYMKELSTNPKWKDTMQSGSGFVIPGAEPPSKRIAGDG